MRYLLLLCTFLPIATQPAIRRAPFLRPMPSSRRRRHGRCLTSCTRWRVCTRGFRAALSSTTTPTISSVRSPPTAAGSTRLTTAAPVRLLRTRPTCWWPRSISRAVKRPLATPPAVKRYVATHASSLAVFQRWLTIGRVCRILPCRAVSICVFQVAGIQYGLARDGTDLTVSAQSWGTAERDIAVVQLGGTSFTPAPYPLPAIVTAERALPSEDLAGSANGTNSTANSTCSSVQAACVLCVWGASL
eukprot:SAG25_NODE_64_length_17680_cov_5.716398_4_plen_246_part_00